MSLISFSQEAKHIAGCKRQGREKDEGKYCFDGEGFVNLLPYSTNKYKKVELQFITLEGNGLILITYNLPRNNENKVAFFALEMRDGVLVSKYDFGGGIKEIVHTTAGKLNDGIPHVFRMRARRGFAKFYVDNTDINAAINVTPLEDGDTRYAVKVINVGGIPFDVVKSQIFPTGYVHTLKY